MIEQMIEELKELMWQSEKDMQLSELIEEAYYYGGLKEAYEKSITIAEKYKAKEVRWIPVEERLPKEDERYLCVSKFCNNYVRDIFFFTKDAYEIDKHDFEQYKGKNKALFYSYDNESGYSERKYVIAWMPLPEYKEGDTE